MMMTLRYTWADVFWFSLFHELGHILKGHCKTGNWMRLLGRATLVGDGFVRAMQDMFGDELDADALAIQQFSVDPRDLMAALQVAIVAQQSRATDARYAALGASIEAAAAAGLMDRRRGILESLTSIRRAGADMILTYFAKEAAAWLS